MKDNEKLHDVITYMMLNKEVIKRKNELDKAINEEDVIHKENIYNKVKETRDLYVKRS